MSPADQSSPVEFSKLRIQRKLRNSASGTTFQAIAPRPLTKAPTCEYKEFSSPSPQASAALRALLEFRSGLAPAEIGMLDSITAWPRRAVESDGRIVGYLTAGVPAQFIEGSIAQRVGTTARLRSLDWLAKPDHGRRVGARLLIEADDVRMRLTLCAHLAKAMQFLHQRGIVVGDVSQAGFAYSGSPAEVILVDVDTVRVASSSPDFTQAHAPGMAPPECRRGQQEQTVETDRFKMAILFHNILGADTRIDAGLSGLTGRVDRAGIQLFQTALGTSGNARPTAATWYRYFYDQLLTQAAPPRITSLEVIPPFAIVGQAIEVTWSAVGHRALTLETPTGGSIPINFSAANSIRLTAGQTGQFSLTATNDHGTAHARSEVVQTFEKPTVRFVDVPELAAVKSVVESIDTDKLKNDIALGGEFSWVDNAPLSAPTPPLNLEKLLGNAVTQDEVGMGLARLIRESMASAEAQVLRSNAGHSTQKASSADQLLASGRAAVSSAVSWAVGWADTRRSGRRQPKDHIQEPVDASTPWTSGWDDAAYRPADPYSNPTWEQSPWATESPQPTHAEQNRGDYRTGWTRRQ